LHRDTEREEKKGMLLVIYGTNPGVLASKAEGKGGKKNAHPWSRTTHLPTALGAKNIAFKRSTAELDGLRSIRKGKVKQQYKSLTGR
jgi:hypothetical protein